MEIAGWLYAKKITRKGLPVAPIGWHARTMLWHSRKLGSKDLTLN